MRYGTIIILFCMPLVIWSQPVTQHSRIFTTKDGLTNNTIYSIAKDSRGFLWLGTKEGLNRFDGLQFKKYFAEKNIQHSLSNNNIFDIVEYRYGQLLIATSNGISVLNSVTGEFENDKISFPSLRAGSNTIINSFLKDKQGQIWINANGEIDILDSNLHYVQRFTDLPWAKKLKGVLIRFGIWQMDNMGRLWLPAAKLYIIDPAAKQIWDDDNNPGDLPFLKHNTIRSIWVDENNKTVWYAPWGLGLFKCDLSTNKEQQQLFSIIDAGEPRSINGIIQNNAGHMICASGKGLYDVDPVTLKYTMLDVNSAGITIYHDRDNKAYWLGTENGLFQFSETPPTKELVINRDQKHPLNCYSIISGANGDLYALYNNVLIEIKPNRTDFTIYPLSQDAGISIFELCEDKNGIIWIATSEGVFLFNPVTKQVTHSSFLMPGTNHFLPNKIFCDSQGTIWFTTNDSFNIIYKLDQRQKQLEKIDDPVIQQFCSENWPKLFIEGITEDAEHNIWMISAMGGGILCYNSHDHTWTIFPKQNSKNSQVLKRAYVTINAIGGYLWLTDFYGNGLVRFDHSKDEVKQFTRNDGLLSDYILNASYDGKEDLWLISEKGITQFNTNTYKSKTNSLPDIEFPSYKDVVSMYDNKSNCIVYGSKNKLTFIQANKIPFNIPPPAPVINSIFIYNQQQFIDPARKFSLQSGQNNISIDFTAIQYNDADKIHFAYQLAGADRDWQYTDLNRVARYSNLAPGDYTFKIKTANVNDNWGDTYTALYFTISPPFWRTWWFMLLAIVIAIMIIYLVIKKRIQGIKNKAELKQRITETEMMALRAQMNPHFIFNCLNAIDNMIQTNQKDKATTYLSRFAQLIRLVLESSKNNLIPFYKDYESLSLFLQLEQFRSNNKFEYELNVDPELLNSGIKVPPLIAQPFVENAIHHGLLNKTGTGRMLSIQVIPEDDYIKYTIIDNGVGRQRSAELNNINRPDHISYGIDIAKKRIAMHNLDKMHAKVVITDLANNGIPAGTKVELWLSVK